MGAIVKGIRSVPWPDGTGESPVRGSYGPRYQSSRGVRTAVGLPDLPPALFTRELVAGVPAGECRRGAVGAPHLYGWACGSDVWDLTRHADAWPRGDPAARHIVGRDCRQPGPGAQTAVGGQGVI